MYLVGLICKCSFQQHGQQMIPVSIASFRVKLKSDELINRKFVELTQTERV